MLHSMRRRMKEMAEAEAGGVSFWTETFDPKVRTRIRHAYDRMARETYFDKTFAAFEDARTMILEQEGMEFLVAGDVVGSRDFELYLERASDDMYPTAIEALAKSLDKHDWLTTYDVGYRVGRPGRLAAAVNEIFSQERVAWQLINDEMIPMKSMELHHEVVEPALRLLHDPRFPGAESAYRKALDELSKGDGADAVTDAGTALQELLTALGCEGNQLGDLIKSARKKRLLASHDSPLLDAVEKAMQWVSADRSETGEAHHASDATRSDAWLIVHIVGAFVVRLASDEARTSA